MKVRRVEPDDREFVRDAVVGAFASTRVVSRGRVHDDASALDGFVVESDGRSIGCALWREIEGDAELVVIVTPHLVAPGVPGQQLASPLDNHIPSNDVDFFLMGQMEQRKVFRDYITSGGDIQGPYGHMIRGAAGSPVLSTKN